MPSQRRSGSRLPKDWKRRRARILHRDPTCKACGINRSTQVDHIDRLGGDDDDNLQGICDPCHLSKSGREGMEARRRKLWREPHPGEAATGGGG